jgi:hypothetical protein
MRAQDAPAKSWSFEAGADRSSIYLFRGVDLLDDESVIAPWAKWSWGDFVVSYYGYFGDLPGSDRYMEGDLSADYTFTMGSASLTLGALTYQFNADAERDLGFQDTYEVYGALAFGSAERLLATLYYNYDFDQVDGGYLMFELKHSFPLGSRVSLDVAGSAGFDFHYNNNEVGAGTFNDVLFSVDLPIQLNDHFSIHAKAQRSIAQKALDRIAGDDPRLERVFGDQSVVTAGATVSF